METNVIIFIVGLLSAVFGALFKWGSDRHGNDTRLTIAAREALLKEAESIRSELRLEIADGRADTAELRTRVDLLTAENLTLRRERMEADRLHHGEVLRINADWQLRYDDLHHLFDELTRKYEAAMQIIERANAINVAGGEAR